MPLHYIIDGYNVVNKVSFLKNKGLREARDGLLNFIEINHPQGSSTNNITVVFDGREDVFDFETKHNFGVVFTKGQSADDYIKDFVDKSTHKKSIIVVSEDKEVIFYCRPQGAKILTVGEFMGKPSKAKRRKNSDEGEKRSLTPAQAMKINAELTKIWLK